jgi:hypothetical protein
LNIGWSFQPSGLWDGWNDPSIANFKGKILESLTRETIQNSLDAAESEDEPVHIEISEKRLDLVDIPNIDEIKIKLEKCWDFVEHESENSRAEMLAAREALSGDNILVLSVADYGTTGMPGPCELGKPFFSYLKARGQSGGSTSRGGSHGIGKAAPLCASTLRTIFVSTLWEDEKTGEQKTLIQGRTTLMIWQRSSRHGTRFIWRRPAPTANPTSSTGAASRDFSRSSTPNGWPSPILPATGNTSRSVMPPRTRRRSSF